MLHPSAKIEKFSIDAMPGAPVLDVRLFVTRAEYRTRDWWLWYKKDLDRSFPEDAHEAWHQSLIYTSLTHIFEDVAVSTEAIRFHGEKRRIFRYKLGRYPLPDQCPFDPRFVGRHCQNPGDHTGEIKQILLAAGATGVKVKVTTYFSHESWRKVRSAVHCCIFLYRAKRLANFTRALELVRSITHEVGHHLPEEVLKIIATHTTLPV